MGFDDLPCMPSVAGMPCDDGLVLPFAALLSTACAVWVAMLGLVFKADKVHHLGMACVGANAVISCYTHMEAGGPFWAWYAVAAACTWVACGHVKKVADPRWTRRERRALAELFARDPWRKQFASRDFWFTSTKTRHERPAPPYVAPPAPVAWM